MSSDEWRSYVRQLEDLVATQRRAGEGGGERNHHMLKPDPERFVELVKATILAKNAAIKPIREIASHTGMPELASVLRDFDPLTTALADLQFLQDSALAFFTSSRWRSVFFTMLDAGMRRLG